MTKECMVTTIDNPYNPFEDFTNWFLFDTEKGYNTSSKLARLSSYTEDMTDLERAEEMERAIDCLLKVDFRGVYVKIIEDTPLPTAVKIDTTY
jgi:hypothetical protein